MDYECTYGVHTDTSNPNPQPQGLFWFPLSLLISPSSNREKPVPVFLNILICLVLEHTGILFRSGNHTMAQVSVQTRVWCSFRVLSLTWGFIVKMPG